MAKQSVEVVLAELLVAQTDFNLQTVQTMILIASKFDLAEDDPLRQEFHDLSKKNETFLNLVKKYIDSVYQQ